MTSSAASAKATVAALAKTDPNHPRLPYARRDLRYAVVEQQLIRALSQTPSLTTEQLGNLAAVIGGAR